MNEGEWFWCHICPPWCLPWVTRVLLLTYLFFLKAPNPQSTSDDYIARNQGGLYNNFKPPPGQQYLARGHLVPNADFGSDAERALTFIMTNVAPKWQLFNMGNWFALERAIRTYANRKKRKIYVFSGVGKCQSKNSARNILPLEKRFRKSAQMWVFAVVIRHICCSSSVGKD